MKNESIFNCIAFQRIKQNYFERNKKQKAIQKLKYFPLNFLKFQTINLEL